MLTNVFIVLVINIICIVPIFILEGIVIGLIYLIRTKLISNTFKILIIIIILLFIAIILVNFTYIEKPNDLYIKMKKVNDNKSLIGLSKEQILPGG